MRTRFQLLLISFAILPLIISCSKDSDNNGGPNTPTEIVIDLPTAGQIVFNGANLRIEGTVTDNNIISNVSVQVRNKTTGAVLYSAQSPTPNVSFYRYTYNWSVTGVTSSFIATVKVTGRDVNSNEGFKEVDITLEP